MHYTSGTYCIPLELTIDQARSASHQGQCDADVEALARVPAIAAQLEAVDPAKLANELREYGAWNDDDLADHTQNLRRFLWLAAGDIVDEATQWKDAIRKHAKEHYAEGGWDILVECYDDSDIYDMIEGCDSEDEAIEACRERLAISDDVRRDIEAERF